MQDIGKEKKIIICIDEIDTGLHPTAQQSFCSYLFKYARKNNVQLFITTHNLEFIDNMLKAGQKMSNKDRKNTKVFSIVEVDGKPVAHCMDSVEALSVRTNYSLELR